MFRIKKATECCICVDLEEPLTGNACSQLFIEIVKYVIYQKQQIPLSYDSLIKLHATSKKTDRNLLSMKNIIDSLDTISSELVLQFSNDNCQIKEIVIAIGATIVSPKLCIILEVPSKILNSNSHLEYQHSFRKPLLHLMRSLFECTEFQDEMTVPLAPTNSFVFVQKKDPYKLSGFFIPRPQFSLSLQNTKFFRIKLNCNENDGLKCSCDNLIKVHHDSPKNKTREINCISENLNTEITYQWYQSKEVVKGFKFLRL